MLWAQRRQLNVREGTSTAGLMPPANANRSGRTRGQFHRCIASHGHPHHCTRAAIRAHRKPPLNIRKQVGGEVIPKPLLRIAGGVHPVGRAAFRHDQNVAARRVLAHVGVVRPVFVSATPAMEQIDRGQLPSWRQLGRQIHAIGHIAPQRRRPEGHILHAHACKGAGIIHKHWPTLATPSCQQAQHRDKQPITKGTFHRRADCRRNGNRPSNEISNWCVIALYTGCILVPLSRALSISL